MNAEASTRFDPERYRDWRGTAFLAMSAAKAARGRP